MSDQEKASILLSFPGEKVVRAFGGKGGVKLLPGGEGASYSAGNIVLKLADNEEEASWSAELMSSIIEDGFRVARPVKSLYGAWVYNGWIAFRYIEGKEVKGRYSEKIELSRKFHKSLSQFDRPAFLDKKNNPYVIADRMTWGVQPLKYSSQLEHVLSPLRKKLKPLQLEEQLIHGDMAGNILFHKTLSPAVIDMTPYWHPEEYADAIIIVDSIVWDKAGDSFLDALENSFVMNQLLLRAVIWRMKTTDEFIQRGDKTSWDYVNAYQHFIELLLNRIKKS